MGLTGFDGLCLVASSASILEPKCLNLVNRKTTDNSFVKFAAAAAKANCSAAPLARAAA